MFNLFTPPAKKHPVVEATEKMVAERSPDAIASYDAIEAEANAQLDKTRQSAEEVRIAAVEEDYRIENETVGKALTVASSRKESALKAAVDKIFCS